MKQKANEWVSIADLMAGVMAVMMLLLVLSVLQKAVAVQGSEASEKCRISQMLHQLKETLRKDGESSAVEIDESTGTVTLHDNVYDRGSACVTQNVKKAFRDIEPNITGFMAKDAKVQVMVEGHTDNIPVTKPVLDIARFCTVYDDNFTLSAARAREARRLLIGSLSSENSRRVFVAGYGDSQPLDNYDPSDARNRRVEVRFVVQDGNRSSPKTSGGNSVGVLK